MLRIPLARTLAEGETLSLEYATTFHYRGEMTGEERQYRRAVMRRVDNIDLRVEFDPEYVPPACLVGGVGRSRGWRRRAAPGAAG